MNYDMFLTIQLIIENAIKNGYLTELDIENILSLFNDNINLKKEICADNKKMGKKSKTVDNVRRKCYIKYIYLYNSLRIEIVTLLGALYYDKCNKKSDNAVFANKQIIKRR